MAGRIDPDPVKKPGVAQPAKPGAAPPAAARAAAPAKAPAPARPAGPPPAGGKPGTAAAQRTDGDAEEQEGDGEGHVVPAGFLKQMPAWAISMLVHVVALLAMALMVTPPPQKEKIRIIESSAPEVEENFEDFEEEEPIENTEQTEVAEMVVPTDVAVVEDVKVIANADDVDAAPLAVELTDFGSETAPAADMMATIGVAGGTAPGGLGGRANASAMAAAGGGGGDTEAAVDRALKWFIEHQLDDGSWSFNLEECPKCKGKCSQSGRYEDRAGATAMALLPFLGRGFTHKEGPYKKQIERGMAFLAARAVQQKGVVYDPKFGHGLYVQGLAGIALSECYGMTQDNRLAMPAQLTLNHIMEAQDQRGGGWRYRPGQAGDTSAVGWQIMALKSGHMAYLQVNPLTIKKAVDFLNSVQSNEGATYGYTDNSNSRPALSAVGLLCRMYLGWKKENPALQDGVARLAKIGPTTDLYYDYYATQIMHHMEGDVWVAWNTKMKSLLLKTQSTKDHEAGSWLEGVNGGGHAVNYGGRLYCTSLATMILEVYYRHLPIYRNASVDEEFKE